MTNTNNNTLEMVTFHCRDQLRVSILLVWVLGEVFTALWSPSLFCLTRDIWNNVLLWGSVLPLHRPPCLATFLCGGWWQHRSSAGLGWLERTGPGLGRAHSRAGPRTPANTDTTSLASFDNNVALCAHCAGMHCNVILVGACVYNRNSERKLSDRVDGI